jgi:hypothetical protein
MILNPEVSRGSGVTKRDEFLGCFLFEEELQHCAALENYWLRARSSPR